MLTGEKRAVLVHPMLKAVLGSLNAAIWMSQILYWYDKGNKQGEIYKSRSQLEKETGLSRDQQIRVENLLKKIGVVKITVKPGRPSLINHITIEKGVLEKLILNVRNISILEERQAEAQTNSLTTSFQPHQHTQDTENIPEITQKNIQKESINKASVNNSGYLDYLANRKARNI